MIFHLSQYNQSITRNYYYNCMIQEALKNSQQLAQHHEFPSVVEEFVEKDEDEVINAEEIARKLGKLSKSELSDIVITLLQSHANMNKKIKGLKEENKANKVALEEIKETLKKQSSDLSKIQQEIKIKPMHGLEFIWTLFTWGAQIFVYSIVLKNMDKNNFNSEERVASCFTVVPLINFMVEKRNALWHRITCWRQGFNGQ